MEPATDICGQKFWQEYNKGRHWQAGRHLVDVEKAEMASTWRLLIEWAWVGCLSKLWGSLM
jgi:hypothetical protein